MMGWRVGYIAYHALGAEGSLGAQLLKVQVWARPPAGHLQHGHASCG
jgi:hypothetical protein